MLTIGFKKLSENAQIPTKAHATDSGFDLYAAEEVVIAPGETAVIKTDIAIQLPDGYEAQVRPRSGVTSKTKLRVQLGTIDNAYRGNIGIIVDNTSPYLLAREYNRADISHIANTNNTDNLCYQIKKGDKLAQLVVQALPAAVAVEVNELDETDRNDKGFGSSGV